MTGPFDPSLLYAECFRCKAPVLRAADPCEALLWMGIAPESLDADCLLLYDGCPNCSPVRRDYEARFVRLRARERRPEAH